MAIGLNQPTARRCYAVGRALRTAVESWEFDQRVAILGMQSDLQHVLDTNLDALHRVGTRPAELRAVLVFPARHAAGVP